MAGETLRRTISQLSSAATTLAGLGLALERQLSGSPLDPALAGPIDRLIETLGLTDLGELSEPELRQALGEVRMTAIQAALLVQSGPVQPGWAHLDEEMLISIGDASALFAGVVQRLLVPNLPGLGDRLATPGAAFLDVGVGVGSIALAMARAFPTLQVVGIDPWTPALSIARRRTEAAGLADRISLRQETCQALADHEAYALVVFPGPFIQRDATPQALERLSDAIRPDGWIAFGQLNLGADPLKATAADVRTAYWGEGIGDPAEAAAALSAAGFVDVRPLPSPPEALMAIVAGRRPA
ncbi:MAG: class I SAM-dependent methyltransferase [Dehalococcoidia bacterium]